MLESDFNNWEHAAGCMLWWAEGDKSKNCLSITNCDIRMLKFFISFVKKYYSVYDEQICIRIQHFGILSEDEVKNYWKKELNLEKALFNKSNIKKTKEPNVKWKYGICKIRICSTELVSRIWGSVQWYIGFSDPDGLSKP